MLDSTEGKYILDRLRQELPAQYHYHNVNHTLDVYHAAEAIAKNEGIGAPDTRMLLIAALYHDCGYLQRSTTHEITSCNIARRALTRFGYTPADINGVCRLIMATQLPQQPDTLLQQIICDADLDYVGRQDFITTGNNLYLEMLALGTINNRADWDNLQISFLQQHHYFTATSLKNRQPKQQENLADLQNKNTNANEYEQQGKN